MYAKNRRKAFEYMLDLIGPEDFKVLPIFIFGDFNFRLDTKAVVQVCLAILTNNSVKINMFIILFT